MKKYILSLMTLVGFIMPHTGYAATMSELQQQLNALMAQLAALQGPPASASATGESHSEICAFNRNLYLGVSGSDVSCLQNYLIKQGYLKVGATGYFGAATKAAVVAWQGVRGISATGFFGQLSRSTHTALFDATKNQLPPAISNTQPTSTQILPPPPPTSSLPALISPSISGSGALTLGPVSYGSLRTSAVMGSFANDVVRFRVVNDNVANIRLTDLVITDSITNSSGNRSSFTNFYLYDGATAVAGPLQMSMSSSATGTVSFSIAGNGAVVPRNQSRDFIVRADVAGSSTGGAVSGSVHTFSVTTAGARIVDTGTVAVINISNVLILPITIRATDQQLSSSALGVTTSRVRTSVDDVAQLNIAADGAVSVGLSSIRLTFSGGSLSGAGAFSVSLIDPSTNVNLGAATPQTCTPASSSCTVLFSPSYSISPGTTKPIKVRIDSSGFTNGVGSSDALSIMIVSTSDFTWTDGVTTGEIASTLVPFTVATLAYE